MEPPSLPFGQPLRGGAAVIDFLIANFAKPSPKFTKVIPNAVFEAWFCGIDAPKHRAVIEFIDIKEQRGRGARS